MDQEREGSADLGTARTALEPVLAKRDACRGAETQALHDRLLARMAAVGDAVSTDRDPELEQTRLWRAEPTR